MSQESSPTEKKKDDVPQNPVTVLPPPPADEKKKDEIPQPSITAVVPSPPDAADKKDEPQKLETPLTVSPPEAPVVAEVPASLVAIVVDDEPANRDFLVRLIAQAKYDCRGAGTGKEALAVAESLTISPMLIVIDSELPDTKGLVLVKKFREMYPNSKIIMATMHDHRSLILQAFTEGCNSFLVKPHGFMELFKRLQKLPTEPTILDRIIIDAHGTREFKA